MATSSYQEISVATGVTGPTVSVDTISSDLGVQVTPAEGGSCKLQYSLFAAPGTLDWIDWIHGTITSAKCVDLSPSVRNIRLVSVSGAATAAISGRSI